MSNTFYFVLSMWMISFLRASFNDENGELISEIVVCNNSDKIAYVRTIDKSVRLKKKLNNNHCSFRIKKPVHHLFHVRHKIVLPIDDKKVFDSNFLDLQNIADFYVKEQSVISDDSPLFKKAKYDLGEVSLRLDESRVIYSCVNGKSQILSAWLVSVSVSVKDFNKIVDIYVSNGFIYTYFDKKCNSIFSKNSRIKLSKFKPIQSFSELKKTEEIKFVHFIHKNDFERLSSAYDVVMNTNET